MLKAGSAPLSDRELLTRFIRGQCEESFAMFVNRHESELRSTAYRNLGDVGLSEEVAQRVFMRLLAKVEEAGVPPRLPAWLHKAAKLECQNVYRSVKRYGRKLRAYHQEQERHLIHWHPELTADLSEALRSLSDQDRAALQMRFFEDRSYDEMASALGKSEQACRKQTSRALSRMRHLLVQGGLLTTVTAMSIGKTSIAIVIALAAIPIGWQWKSNRALRNELEVLRAERVRLASGSAITDTLIPEPRSESAVAVVPSTEDQWSSKFRAVAWERIDPMPTNLPPLPMTADDVDQFLQLPVEEQARALAWYKMKGGPESLETEERVQLREVIKDNLRLKLDKLEEHPEAMAVFQSRYVSELLGTLEQETVEKIESIVLDAYQQAVAQGLESGSRPTDSTLYEAWATGRDALDRPATRAVQALLTPEQRLQFDRNFIGIMGIDLGVGDGVWHRFMEGDNMIVFPSEGE